MEAKRDRIICRSALSACGPAGGISLPYCVELGRLGAAVQGERIRDMAPGHWDFYIKSGESCGCYHKSGDFVLRKMSNISWNLFTDRP